MFYVNSLSRSACSVWLLSKLMWLPQSCVEFDGISLRPSRKKRRRGMVCVKPDAGEEMEFPKVWGWGFILISTYQFCHTLPKGLPSSMLSLLKSLFIAVSRSGNEDLCASTVELSHAKLCRTEMVHCVPEVFCGLKTGLLLMSLWDRGSGGSILHNFARLKLPNSCKMMYV